MSRGEATAGIPASDHGHGNHAANNMQQVQPSDAEEAGAKKRRAPGILEQPNPLMNQPGPFADVENCENCAEDHRDPEPAQGFGFLA